jgi:hypothetical protein
MKKVYKIENGKLVEVKDFKQSISTLIKTKGPGIKWSYKSGSKV